MAKAIEWKSPYNSFNSMKGLCWYTTHYQPIAKWWKGETDVLPPPIELSLDPSHLCNFNCPHCFDGNEEIMIDDFNVKKIKDIKIGDTVLGLKDNKLTPTKVLKVFFNGKTEEMYKFIFEDGDSFICTGDHKIWEPRCRWKYAKNFRVGNVVKKIFKQDNRQINLNKYEEGYIAGIALGDGCFWLSKNRDRKGFYRKKKSGRFRLMMYDEIAMETFGKYCSDLGIRWHWGKCDFRGHKDYYPTLKYSKKALWITDNNNALKIRELMDTEIKDYSFIVGWIAGIFDAEGSFSRSIRIHQFNDNVLHKLFENLNFLKYKYKVETKEGKTSGIRLYGNLYTKINFFLTHRPKIERKFKCIFNIKKHNKIKILKILKIKGIFEKVDLETETHNYFMKGVLVHNCNAQRYLVHHPEQVPRDKKVMTKEHLERLIDFCADWGIQGVCLGGGGESLMNKNIWELTPYIASKGMEPSFATNGSLINKQMAEEMMLCRWVGVSVDAGTRETFQRVHQVDLFDRVIQNLRMLVTQRERTKSNCDISYKFLISPLNAHEIEQACKLAKEIGVRDFHVRPADLERLDYKSQLKPEYDVSSIQEQFARCHEMEDERFRVFTVMHKYDPNFRVTHKFRSCIGSPLMLQACADGGIYVCADHRIEPRFRIGSHYPNPEEIKRFWGSPQHRELLQGINVDKECRRCTYGSFAQQIEELCLGTKGEDPMCLSFP